MDRDYLNSLMSEKFQGVNREGVVHYFEDNTRVQLTPFDYDGGNNPVSETGTVIHDMGGENVPVYIDGRNDSTMPHDYTSVRRSDVVCSWKPED